MPTLATDWLHLTSSFSHLNGFNSETFRPNQTIQNDLTWPTHLHTIITFRTQTYNLQDPLIFQSSGSRHATLKIWSSDWTVPKRNLQLLELVLYRVFAKKGLDCLYRVECKSAELAWFKRAVDCFEGWSVFWLADGVVWLFGLPGLKQSPVCPWSDTKEDRIQGSLPVRKNPKCATCAQA